jgi:hypothetical protein
MPIKQQKLNLEGGMHANQAIEIKPGGRDASQSSNRN